MALKLKTSGASLQNLSLAGKVIIGAIFLALVGAAYFVIFYGEIESEISSKQQQVDGLARELDAAKEARKAFNRDLAEVKRREQLVRKQKTILPDQAESPAFLSAIQNVATISGVELTGWSPQDEAPEAFYAKVPMQLTIRGRYHQVARFFYGIGQADRIINMENITMRARTAAAATPAKGGSIELEEAQQVDVDCLATAFRALRSGESSSRKRKGKGPAEGGAAK